MENNSPLPPDLAELYDIWSQASEECTEMGPRSQRFLPAAAENRDKTPEREKASKLSGRLTATPRFDIREDRIRANFTLAIPTDDGGVNYIQGFSTKDYARRLQGKEFKRGDLLEVTGVWQRHVGKKKDGTLFERQVFYAYGARLRSTR